MLMSTLCWLRNTGPSVEGFLPSSLRVCRWNPKPPHSPLVAFFTECHSTREPKQPSLWEEVKRDCQIKTELPTEPHPSHSQSWRPKEDIDSEEASRYKPPTPSSLMCCWGCLAKKNKNPSETDFPKSHICFQLPMLVQQHSWVPKIHRPLTPPPDRCCSASPLHIHRITSCAKQAVYVERMPS